MNGKIRWILICLTVMFAFSIGLNFYFYNLVRNYDNIPLNRWFQIVLLIPIQNRPLQKVNPQKVRVLLTRPVS